MEANDVAECRKWAGFYRLRGFNPLPAAMDAKRPLVKFAHLWESKAPDDLFDRCETANLMLLCGRWHGLLVIDLDGESAVAHWARLGRTPRTWITHSGGNGRHLWFRVPSDYPEPLPLACLWDGGEKHKRIDRLCDKSVIMVPPSIHPVTGNRYRFIDRVHSPVSCPLPAVCPIWVLRLRPVASKGSVHALPIPRRRVATPASGFVDRDAVIDGLDILEVARDWGIRLTGRVRGDWAECRAIDRDDVHPSAAINTATGVYVDKGNGAVYSLFDLGVELGMGQTWIDVKNTLADGVVR